MDIFDEIRRRCPAVSMDAAELARLDGVDDGLEVSDPDMVDALGIEDGAVGKDLEEHGELAAVIGTARVPSGSGSGSADVTAELTRDLGVRRWAGPAEEESAGVSGSPPKVVRGAGAAAEPAGGRKFAGRPAIGQGSRLVPHRGGAAIRRGRAAPEAGRSAQ